MPLRSATTRQTDKTVGGPGASHPDGETETGQSADAALRPRWPGWTFALTILLGAFLLFQVQPLMSKFILPWFGGCPAVWTTCMLFFQVLLFAGYSYAHLVGSRLSLRRQAIVQAAILAAAVALLPIAPGAGWKPVDSAAPTWRILLVLLATVGLPYFVLSTTSPLVQVWFSRSYPGRSPYRLYALSNFGALAALLSYPVLFEPAFTLPVQSWLWSGTFAVYVLLCGLCAASVWRPGAASDSIAEAATEARSAGIAIANETSGDHGAAGIGWGRRMLWLLLPACASLVLLATTNHVCQDVAVVPFLWVAPLSLYLLSFIICFDHQRWYVRGLWSTLAALGILTICDNSKLLDRLGGLVQRDLSLTYVPGLVLCLATMFFICTVCHGELVRLRPPPRRLTEYYLMISAGGAVGGVLVSLVAPLVFTTFFEWKIGLAASYVIAAAVLTLAAARGALRLGREPAGTRAGRGRLAARVAWTAAVAIVAIDGPATLIDWQTNGAKEPVERTRNFYGVISVWEYDRDDPEQHEFRLWHGAITHGEQFVAAQKRRIPTTYYGYRSGAGRAIEYLQTERPQMRVGLVGLGVGTLAAYARQGDSYRFYEINPEVARLAEKYFYYLADARQRGASTEIVLGDARLSLEREPPQQLDMLVLDAFSGDSIPTHLLTREAFQIFRKHLAPGGVIAVHTTNRHLYLVPVVRGVATDAGLKVARVYTVRDDASHVLGNDWVLLTENEGLLSAIPSIPPPEVHDDFSVPVWTDHYSNLFQILKKAG